jgi:hypothetical protein
MENILKAQINLAPQLYNAEAEYQKKYNALQIEQQKAMAQANIETSAQLYPQVSKIEAAYNAANRAAEVKQLETSLPQFQAAFNKLTPGYAEALDSTGQLARKAMNNALEQPNLSAYEQSVGGPQMRSNLGQIDTGIVNQYVGAMPGMKDYANYLAKYSRTELEAGKSLTPEEQRLADQSARSAYAARGTALSSQAVNAEILNRSDLSNQRYQQRLANAANAANQIQGIYTPALNQAYQRQSDTHQFEAQQQQTSFNQALQRNQAQQQRLMSRTQIQAGYAQLGAGALGQLQQAQAPILQAYYKQPILQGESAQAQQMGLAMQQQAGPQYFNPESQTGMGSIYGAYNSQMNLAGAQAQANAMAQAGKSSMWGQLGGAVLGVGGSLGAASILKCWVAREVYGVDNPAWIAFRDWLTHDAPKWLDNAYIKYGERIAAFIKDKPLLKNLIRRWMDSKIA